jgi:hypothetical protein
MASMLSGASDFNQDLSSLPIKSVINLTNILLNTALSTYNYNQLLFGRSKQTVQPNLTLTTEPSQYAGCELNAGQGIAGHTALSALPAP